MILLCVSGNLVDMVEEVTYFVHEDFAEETFRSCKDVLNPATSGSVMNLLCGPWGLHLCTARRWFDYMGSTSNGYSPFTIAYNYSREVSECLRMKWEITSFLLLYSSPGNIYLPHDPN